MGGLAWRGSSPRMRGAHIPGRILKMSNRIIPADAGSTRAWPWPCSAPWDHPRGCGEHYGRIRKMTDLTWIIPADAGSTIIRNIILDLTQDHPRGCGEHRLYCSARARTCGSSPRMRGAQAEGVKEHPNKRIIPADAGSTLSPPTGSSIRPDHPRGCGEHYRQTG